MLSFALPQGRTIRKVMEGGGLGIFELYELFFVNISLAGMFLPYARTFLGY